MELPEFGLPGNNEEWYICNGSTILPSTLSTPVLSTLYHVLHSNSSLYVGYLSRQRSKHYLVQQYLVVWFMTRESVKV